MLSAAAEPAWTESTAGTSDGSGMRELTKEVVDEILTNYPIPYLLDLSQNSLRNLGQLVSTGCS